MQFSRTHLNVKIIQTRRPIIFAFPHTTKQAKQRRVISNTLKIIDWYQNPCIFTSAQLDLLLFLLGFYLFLLTGETDQHGRKLKIGFEDGYSVIILSHNFFSGCKRVCRRGDFYDCIVLLVCLIIITALSAISHTQMSGFFYEPEVSTWLLRQRKLQCD